jgi:hypothetical protein
VVRGLDGRRDSPGVASNRRFALRGLDLKKTDERRLILLIERDNLEDARNLWPAPRWISSPGLIITA